MRSVRTVVALSNPRDYSSLNIFQTFPLGKSGSHDSYNDTHILKFELADELKLKQ
jgi:hypothetical protein